GLDDHGYQQRKVESEADRAVARQLHDPNVMAACRRITDDGFRCLLAAEVLPEVERCPIARTRPVADEAKPACGAPTAVGDGPATIRGRIVEAGGGPLEGATVVADRSRTQVADYSHTNGAFSLTVPAGIYTLTVYYEAMTHEQSCVVVRGGSTVTIDVTMQPR